MKRIILLNSLLIASLVVWGQKDTSQIKTKTYPTNEKVNIQTKPASVRMKEIEVIFDKMQVKLEELRVLTDKLKDNKDAISEMNEMDMLMLQQLMEKKNQLETMISNTMKAAHEGAQAAIQALKAS